MADGVRIEYADRRKLRERNKPIYRLAHWPIWIAVFYLVPGPVTFRLFAGHLDWRMSAWLGLAMIVTGIAGWLGRLPGVEPRPYIIRFTEDKVNPLYRRVCYTVAWSELVAYAALNLTGLVVACGTGKWRMGEIYAGGYWPIVAIVWALGAFGVLPRVRASTKGEGDERRYFYGLVWAAPLAQGLLWMLWRVLPVTATTNWVKLGVFVSALGFMGWLAACGVLPRTRKIVPGEVAVAD